MTAMGLLMYLVCSWNEVGDVLCQVSSSPFCTRPFWRMPKNDGNHENHENDETLKTTQTATNKELSVGFAEKLRKPPKCPKKDTRMSYQKKPNVCDFSVRSSRAGNGCANFMGAWDFFRKRQFVHKMFVHNFVPLEPKPSQPAK